MNTDDLREQFFKEHPNSKMDKCIMHEDVGYDYFTDDYVLWLEKKLMLYNVVGQSEQLKAEDKDLPFADYLEKWYELPRYEKVYDRKDGKGTDTEDEVIKNYRRAFRL